MCDRWYIYEKHFHLDEAIKFYGDPLIDFSLTHFLERFAFKNPKKEAEEKPMSLVKSIYNRSYSSHGSRGQSVQRLTGLNCSEEEKFIFAYLDKKKERRALFGLDKKNADNDDIDDDEFEAYLDGLGGKKTGKSEGDVDSEDDEFDFMGDFNDGSTKKDMDDGDADWDSDGNDDDEDDVEANVSQFAYK